jgi:DNA repair exonuclease SbcCD ATPase subunit
MVPEETRRQIRERVERWQAKLEQLRAEGKGNTGEARRAHITRLQELQAKIAEEIREWNARIDDYDTDPTRTTQREFDERASLRDIERQIKAEVTLALTVGHDVG